MTYVDHPLEIDRRGRTATTSYTDHVRDLVEQVLFTSPGERVNRPDFGAGLLELVFADNGDPLAAATEMTVQAALIQWLGDVVEVREVTVDTDESVLRVAVRYALRRTGETRGETFQRVLS